MKRPAIGKALVLCAALSLPALAAAPAAATEELRRQQSARVIVKFKSEGSLMRESALAARAGERRAGATRGALVAAPRYAL